MNKQNALILTLLGAFCLLIATGCNTLRGKSAAENYNADPLSVEIPAGLTPAQVQDAMARALTGRGWTVVSTSPQEVIGELDHRGFRAKATLQVSGNQIRILSDSTYLSPKSEDYKPAVPYGWLENLQKDMRRYLAQATY